MKLVLAPLAGFTDAPFRMMAREGGADLAYTEMVSAAALSRGHEATNELIATLPGECPLAAQIFGAKVDEVAAATRIVSATGRFTEINLNAGCPMKKVVRSGSGAKLIEDPALVHTLLKAMAANTALPVTLKTRLGPQPDKVAVFELLDAAESAGAAGIIVHARYTSQLHGGAVNLDLLGEVASRAKIPVTGNGSVMDSASLEAMADTGVAAVMIGRAALSRPDIFRVLKGGERSDARELFARHLALVEEFHPILAASRKDPARAPSLDAYAALKARTHLFRYFAGVPGAAALRAQFNKVRTLAHARRLAYLSSS